ncbi:MAG: 16S rRNA (cytosine(1402)-N(4))-methyltransferase RsmH [Lachnospiraceae bacterium]|nr:16S rRNA (cytosine(1402)-N(4))-methyltransferase RsmH [Candidatus Colinaster scatohippi]
MENNYTKNSIDNNTPHKRRVRYSGKYPKRYEEKYKELNPEKYKDIADHVKAKGNTPAGTHISIMVDEILEFLDIKPGQQGLDCTFGYGGHSSHMLSKLNGQGHLISLDVDPIESAKSKKRLENMGYGEDILTVELTNFANIDKIAEKYGKFDFVLADLGVSSMQIDNPERGFSYKIDGPLDLRLDPTKGITAAERILELDEDDLIGVLIENADEPYAELIAKTVTSFKKSGQPIETTTQFRKIIEKALSTANIPKNEFKDTVKKSCARCFQALRIDINHEYDVLYDLLCKLPGVLNPGGRVAILTFHSGEDRLVKQAFKQQAREGLYSEVARDVIRPSAKECVDNPRSKSTKMRWAIK